jgi:nucleoside-diphosphate-sugar epimerase
VRAVDRSGRNALPEGVERVAADIMNAAAAQRACKGATVVYHVANPPYAEWPALHPPLMGAAINAAASAKARLVFGDNLYAYGPVDGPITEDMPHHAKGPNGLSRVKVAHSLMDAHKAGTVQAAIGRGSDFYGPHARISLVGDRVFARAVRGRSAQVLGDPDLPHTVTYIEDFARALVTLGADERALGEVWHVPNAPTVSMSDFVALVAAEVGRPSRIQIAPNWTLSLAGLFSPMIRALREQRYQVERPWLVDSCKFERAFGWKATPLQEGIRETVAWFRGLSMN